MLGAGLASAIIQKPLVQSSSALPVDEVIGFAYHGKGEEFHLFPSQVSGKTITYRGSHFSGYGAARGTPGERRPQQNRVPTSSEDQANQEQEDFEPVPLISPQDYAVNRFAKVVFPKLVAAESNKGFLEAAVSEFLAWRALPKVDFSKLSTQNTMALNSLAKGIKNAIATESARCSSQKDPAEAAKMQRWAAVARQFGLNNRAGLDEKAVQEKINKCFRFEFDFDSTITFQSGENTGSSRVRSVNKVPVTLKTDPNNPNNPYLSGEAQSEYVNFTITVPGCGVSDIAKRLLSSNILSGYVFYNLNIGKAGGDPKLFFGVFPGGFEESWREKCGDAPATLEKGFFFSGYYGQAHLDEVPPSGNGIALWHSVGLGAWVYRADFDRTITLEQDEFFTEMTVLFLHHAPEQ